MWQQWVNFLAGLWLILSAFLGFSASGATTNLIVVGIVVALLSLWDEFQYHVGESSSHSMG